MYMGIYVKYISPTKSILKYFDVDDITMKIMILLHLHVGRTISTFI